MCKKILLYRQQDRELTKLVFAHLKSGKFVVVKETLSMSCHTRASSFSACPLPRMCVQAMLAEHSPNCLFIRYHTMPSPSGCLVEFLYLISDRGNIVVEFSYQADRPYKDLKKSKYANFSELSAQSKRLANRPRNFNGEMIGYSMGLSKFASTFQ